MTPTTRRIAGAPSDNGPLGVPLARSRRQDGREDASLTTADVTTLILRFRDLITETGQTVDLHNAISASSPGHVWWGWWNKLGEVVPDDVFRCLRVTAVDSSGLEVLLLDSGRDQVFRATCSDIHWNNNHDLVGSPDPECTPEYYRPRKCLAWFRLGPITPAQEDTFRQFSYVDVAEFFKDHRSRYGAYANKVVCDADELRQQDRSVWFVRPFRSGDRTHQISLLSSFTLSPAHFPAQHVSSKSCNLLWLSDLHFGPAGHHGFQNTGSPARQSLAQVIADTAEKVEVGDLAGVLVTGDLTWSASRAEYEAAEGFLKAICQRPTKLDNYRIVVCPGNHDLCFTSTPEDKTALLADQPVPETARAEFGRFYERLFYLAPNEHLTSGRKFLLGQAMPVEIVSLNSSMLDQKAGWFQGMGFLGAEQLDDAATQMGWHRDDRAPTDARPRAFRIVMLHHHLMPVTFRELPKGGQNYSVVLDAESFAQWIVENEVDLVLHGHMHAPFCARVSRPPGGRPADGVPWHTFHVLGLGSTGVAQQHRGEAQNMFGVLSFSDARVVVRIINISPDGQTSTAWTTTVPVRGHE